jgi:hypothetical protein
MRLTLCFFFLVLASCRNDTLSEAKSGIYLTNQDLVFGPRAIGFSKTLTLVVENVSQKSEFLQIPLAAPFHVDSNIEIPPMSQREISVVFSPEKVGPVEQLVTFNSQMLIVSGTGLAAETCAPSTCISAVTDPNSGRCVTAVETDGNACHNSCIASGQCLAGTCVGTASNCDDNNPCTADSCAANGCQHVAIACAAPSNKCLAARCDAVLGCVSEPVADGTLCGESTCEMAQVCMAGQCQNMVPPDGFVCGKTGPCQSSGRCQNHVCQTEQTGAPPVLWSYTQFDFQYEGVTDENGNIYFTEVAPTNALYWSVVSYTPTGQLRYRTIVSANLSEHPKLHMLEGNKFIFASGNVVVVSNATNGALIWQKEVTGRIEEMATSPDGLTLWISTSIAAAPSFDPGTLLSVSLHTGNTGATISPRHRGLVVDEYNRLWTSQLINGQQRITAYFPSGVELPVPNGPGLIPMVGLPISVMGERLVTSDDTVYNTHTRTLQSPRGFSAIPDSLQGIDFRFRSQTGDFAILPMLKFKSEGPTNPTRTAPMRSSGATLHSGLTLLPNKETLWVSGGGSGSSTLNRWSGAGALSTCPLTQSANLLESSFSGRYLTLSRTAGCCPTCDCASTSKTLVTYDLGNVGVESWGWVTNKGTLGHGLHTPYLLE